MDGSVPDGPHRPRADAYGPPWPPTGFLGQLSEQTRAAAVRLGTPRSFAAGEILLLEGAPSDSAVLLLTGLYKVVGSLGSGREALVAIRVGGDIVGELGLADGQPRVATVRAVGPGAGRRIGERDYHAFLDSHPDAARAVNRAVAGKLRSATRRRVEFATFSAVTRMARVLRELSATHGTRTPEGVLIGVALAQSELAALIGVAEPTVQRVLATMRREGVLDTRYRSIVVLDELRLAELAQP
jgi:CRP/FNR family cyclic AMP-dependent transcriptional regulator